MWVAIASSLLVTSSLAAGVPGELSLTASHERADYGLDEETTIRAYTLRWVHGTDTQWRVELPWLQSDSPEVRLTTAGPVPRDGTRNGNGRRTGAGDGSGNGSANGADGSSSGAIVGTGSELIERSESGVGDLRLGLTRRLRGGGARLLRIDADIEVKIPTADRDTFGSGEADARIGMAWEYRMWSLTTFGGAGWTRLGDPDDFELGDPVDLYAGIESLPWLSERLTGFGWVRGRQEVIDGAGTQLGYGAGLRWSGRVGWTVRVSHFEDEFLDDTLVAAGISFGTSAQPRGSGKVTR